MTVARGLPRRRVGRYREFGDPAAAGLAAVRGPRMRIPLAAGPNTGLVREALPRTAEEGPAPEAMAQGLEPRTRARVPPPHASSALSRYPRNSLPVRRRHGVDIPLLEARRSAREAGLGEAGGSSA